MIGTIVELEWREFDAAGKPALELRFTANGRQYFVGVMVEGANIDRAKGECREGALARLRMVQNAG